MAANIKIFLLSLFTVKIKLISSHVSRYEFSAVGEIFVFSGLRCKTGNAAIIVLVLLRMQNHDVAVTWCPFLEIPDIFSGPEFVF